MSVVPAVKAVTKPDPAFTEATNGLVLVQVPPVGVAESDEDRPTHTDGVPVIAEGSALTVTAVVLKQPGEAVRF